MLAISIDGACRRNGKPNCVSAGGAFILHLDDDLNISQAKLITNYELESTNQRGELLALLTALDYIYAAQKSAQVITDSEYIFNAMTKNWCKGWMNKGWITAAGTPVKNKDIWLEIMNAYNRCLRGDRELMIYHIKGHAVSFGKVTARKLLNGDPTGLSLYYAVKARIAAKGIKAAMYEQVVSLSIKNNGFELDNDTLTRFIASNIVADSLATKCVEAADALM